MQSTKYLFTKWMIVFVCKINRIQTEFAEILENHRISRTIINAITTADDDDSLLDTSKNSLNDTQTERDMNDILGPLPDIPVGCDNSRLSLRRSSGCSGIYEEILDPADANVYVLSRFIFFYFWKITILFFMDFCTNHLYFLL